MCSRGTDGSGTSAPPRAPPSPRSHSPDLESPRWTSVPQGAAGLGVRGASVELTGRTKSLLSLVPTTTVELSSQTYDGQGSNVHAHGSMRVTCELRHTNHNPRNVYSMYLAQYHAQCSAIRHASIKKYDDIQWSRFIENSRLGFMIFRNQGLCVSGTYPCCAVNGCGFCKQSWIFNEQHGIPLLP